MRFRQLFVLAVTFCLAACVRSRPEVIIVTQTPEPQGAVLPATTPFATLPTTNLIQATLDPAQPPDSVVLPSEYEVKPGDTLSSIAAAYGVSVETLQAVNNLPDPNFIAVGQVIRLPEPPDIESTRFKIIPDSRLVRGPGSSAFDATAFVNSLPGYVRLATDTVNGDILTGAQVVERVALEFSVDPRLLLSILEYRAHWLSQTNLADEARVRPLGAQASDAGLDRDGLYKQLTWAADQLNRGYYGWKYRGLTTIEFSDGQRVSFGGGLNAGTIGLQYMLAQFSDETSWRQAISPDGVYRTYVAYFGDPFVGALEPLVPAGLQQPTLSLPFDRSQVWYFTGGPHGGWGSGSAWAAIDFAPPDDLTGVESPCYVSQFWALAVAPGIIARTAEGVVVLDLDGDGDESTGWSILYLHMAADGRTPAHTVVAEGNRVGLPSCEGGFSNGTHLHLARRYNGEWIPADCSACSASQKKPAFVLGNWVVIGLPQQEYQGFLLRGDEQRVAEQGRLNPDNQIAW